MSVYYRTWALSKLGHQVDILTYPIGENVEIANANIIRSWPLPFIHDISIGPSFKKLLLDIMLFAKAVYVLIKGKYDLLFLHEEAVIFGAVANFLFRIQYIYDMHSSLPQQLKNFKFTNSLLFIKLFEVLEKYSLRRASSVISICNDLQDQICCVGLDNKHELIKNTLFHPITYSEDSASVDLKQIIETRGRKVVIYAGSFEPYQGLEMYMEAIKIILSHRSDILFILIGGGPKQVLSMRTRSYESGCADNVIFTGILEVNTVKSFLNRADALVSPRMLGTNTPLKIYEYMASGNPIIATRLKTHTQELDDDCAYLYAPEPEDFARGIMQCLNNKKEAERRAANARLKYEKKYGEKTYLQKIERVLNIASG